MNCLVLRPRPSARRSRAARRRPSGGPGRRSHPKSEWRFCVGIGGRLGKTAQKVLDEGRARLTAQYERELLNPREALSLGSVSSLVIPGESRRVLAKNLDFLMRSYTPSPMGGIQREHD